MSMRFFRQEYWNSLPFPTLEDLPDPGMEFASLVSPALAGRFFTSAPPGKPFTFLPDIKFVISIFNSDMPEIYYLYWI